MKLGVLTVPLSEMSLEEALKYLSSLGVEAVELGSGGFPGSAHLAVREIIADQARADEVLALTQKYNMEISAISAHSNPVHPDAAVAQTAKEDFENSVLVAERLGADTVITFSGCPGDSPGAKYPNWVVCPWPEYNLEILEYQWNEVLIPYWKEAAEFARAHSVTKIALEMHPSFSVYNTETLLKLRAAVGDIIGANFDPSHLFWQGIDPVASILKLGGAIHHFHAKDTKVDSRNTALNGVLDTKHYADVLNRSFVFRTVGYGHGRDVWADMISALKAVGYDGALSIEHEDGLMSVREGLEKAVAFLRDVIIKETAGAMWWA